MALLKKYYYKITVVLLLISGAVTGRANNYDNYCSSNEMPDPQSFLPAPLDSANVTLASDFAGWSWGYGLRNTPRGEQASWESRRGMVRMCTIFSEVLGIDITEDATPAIYRLMYRVGNTCMSNVEAVIPTYHRKRPYALMNEPVWGQFNKPEELQEDHSYPSSPMAYCWGTALALAEVAPHLQDTILRRGIEYGTSSVITGAHWPSDVDAAILSASATIARVHATEQYLADIAAAREEYVALKGPAETNAYPSIDKILDAPLDATNYRFGSDVAQYWQYKSFRDTELWTKAIANDSLTDDYITGLLDACTPLHLSQSETPNIVTFIKFTKLLLNIHATTLKKSVFRLRPYRQFGDKKPFSDLSWKVNLESSYPSRHAMIGWGLALALAEVMPDCQESILKAGYDYGSSRMILGTNYASDLQAARTIAACDLAKLHTIPTFNTLMQRAKEEYQLKK